MSIHAEADLILKLYNLRREETLRAARDWYFREFHPQSIEDVSNAMMGEHSGHLRMVVSYWDMAAALVNHGAISLEMFDDTNGEFIGVFMKLQPFLAEIRAAYGPRFLVSVEKLIDSLPHGRERVNEMRERMKQMMATMANRRAQAAPAQASASAS